MRSLKAAVIYFVLVFGVGFILGPMRVLWLIPRVGTRAAELLETPLMLVAIFLAARWINRRFVATREDASGLVRLRIGLIAFALLLGAELAVGIALRRMSPVEIFTNRDPVSGIVYYISLVIFALMPWLLSKGKGRLPV
jgi:hypothetical protein